MQPALKARVSNAVALTHDHAKVPVQPVKTEGLPAQVTGGSDDPTSVILPDEGS